MEFTYGRLVDCLAIAGIVLLALVAVCHIRTKELISCWSDRISGGFGGTPQ